MRKDAGLPRVNHLPGFYRNKLNPSLQAYVDMCQEQPAHQQYALNEELAIARDSLGQIEETLAVTLEIETTDLKAEQTKELVLIDLRSMRAAALKDIRDMASAAANIDNTSRDKISVHHIAFIVRQITHLAYRAFGDTEQCREFERLLREEIKIPGEVAGTSLTPDAVVTEMDSTIPATP